MARTTDAVPKRPRISLDVDPELRRRLRLASAKRQLTIGQYVRESIEQRLRDDIDGAPDDRWLTAAGDPVLVELWDNELDAAYDRL